jgi:Flp pilus assembly secretin CpaC
VFIAGPDTADVQLGARPDLIYIFGKKPGRTVLYATDNDGNVILNRVIEVPEPAPESILIKVMRDSQRTEVWTSKLEPQPQPQQSETVVKHEIKQEIKQEIKRQ